MNWLDRLNRLQESSKHSQSLHHTRGFKRVRRVSLVILIVALTLCGLSVLPFNFGSVKAVNSTLTSGSWNPKVPCTPQVVTVTDITGLQTGPLSLAASPFSPGTTTSVTGGNAKRWLTPGPTPSGWVPPGPPCKTTNGQGTISVFVQINGLQRGNLVDEDYTTSYDPVNGGGPHLVTGDTTFNLFDPTLVANYSSSCLSRTDPTCMAEIHGEIDHDWKAAGYCGVGTVCDDNALATQTIASSTLIDVQGFVYWDPSHLDEAGHQFSGWELHPLTAWRFSTVPLPSPVSLSWTPSNPQVGEIVSFTAKTSGPSLLSGFKWDFGDGVTASGRKVSHIYLLPKAFNLQLTAIDGLRSDTIQGLVTVGSWSPEVACSPAQTTVENILGSVPIQRLPTDPNSTGADYSGGGFKPNGNLAYGSNPVHWPFFKRDLQPRCSIGGIASFVELHNVTVTSRNLNDCGTTYSTDSGGGSYPDGWQSCDTTFNLATPGFGDDSTCPTCYLHRLYAGIDRDWNATGVAPMPAPLEGERIDLQGFVFWNHDLVNASFHSFSGWELHPVTAWRLTESPVSPSISLIPSHPKAGEPVTFNGTASGGTGPYSFTWDFGNGKIATGNLVNQVYGPGKFTVHMAATDSLGTVGTTLETVHVGGPPSFTVSASDPSLTLHVGTSGSSTITLDSTNGFSDTVELFPIIYPFGPPIDLDPSIVTLVPYGQATAVLTVSPGPFTPPGHYTVNIFAFSDTVIRRIRVTVNVEGPSFLLNTSPDRLVLRAGSSGTSEITTASFEGFNGNIALAHSPIPPGVRVTFNPDQLKLDSGGTDRGSLTVSTSATTPAGSYVLTFAGSNGHLTRRVTLHLIVTSGIVISANPTSLTVDSGTTRASAISLRSLGYKGAVRISASVSNPDLIATLGPSSLTLNPGETRNLELKVTATEAGTYRVTITANTGHTGRSVTVSVIVLD